MTQIIDWVLLFFHCYSLRLWSNHIVKSCCPLGGSGCVCWGKSLIVRTWGRQKPRVWSCGFKETIIFHQGWQLKDHFTNNIAGMTISTCIQGSSLLLTLLLPWGTEKHLPPEVKDKVWNQLWKRPAFFSALNFVLLPILNSYLMK